MSSNSSIPAEVLEQRAAEQRRRLHNSVSELRSSVAETVKETLDAKKYLREYAGPATATAAAVGLLMGYAVAGVFTRR
jgi:ElaB/YqjD/DUF883 family membrane-anchored ribosome-binding protein